MTLTTTKAMTLPGETTLRPTSDTTIVTTSATGQHIRPT